MMKLGEVKMPTDEDFQHVRRLCESDEGWLQQYNKNNIRVWMKKSDMCAFHMIKTRAEYADLSADLLYRVFQDNEFRPEFDDRMLDSHEICYISPCSDIGYYALKSPRPFKNRDFVTQRCWLDFGPNAEKIIYNHSVDHAKAPIKDNFIRGISYITATYIKPISAKSCIFFYVTQSDPGGSLPTWIVNKATTVFAPKFCKKVYKAALKYDKWKAKHNPDHMPWMNPEQISVPRIDWNDIRQFDKSELMNLQKIPDENNIDEHELQEDKKDNEED